MGKLAKSSDTKGSKQTTEIPLEGLKVGDKFTFNVKLKKTRWYVSLPVRSTHPKKKA